MDDLTRRSAISMALLAGGAATAFAESAPEEAVSKDEEFVMAAGLTKEEAACWQKLAEAAGAFFQLEELHPMDKQEVASAIHIVQNKLLGRPTYRKYVKLAKEGRDAGD